MGFSATLIFYILIGGGVAFAMAVVEERRAPFERIGRGALAVLFWPLFVPVLLSRPAAMDEPIHSPIVVGGRPPDDELARAIRLVEEELDTALRSLDGWAEEVLSLEEDRIDELRGMWRAHAERIRDLDRLLESPGFAEVESENPADAAGGLEDERLRHSARVRRENIDRLRRIRRQMHDDLIGTLAWVRELVTMIHLAKYTGAPAARAEELVARIAAAVEGLAEVSNWTDEPSGATVEPVSSV
ncbi:MAG: hypothetical protein WD066_02355 [Planctomycetaceae bacterium]